MERTLRKFKAVCLREMEREEKSGKLRKGI